MDNQLKPGKVIPADQIVEIKPSDAAKNIIEKYLELLPIMTSREREVLIESIHWLNNPMFKFVMKDEYTTQTNIKLKLET